MNSLTRLRKEHGVLRKELNVLKQKYPDAYKKVNENHKDQK